MKVCLVYFERVYISLQRDGHGPNEVAEKTLTLKALNKNCSRRHFNFLLLHGAEPYRILAVKHRILVVIFGLYL